MPTVDINGHEVEYDQEVAESWDVADLLVTIDDAAPISQYEKLTNMFRIVEMCTGLDKPHFVELCGGGRVKRDELARLLGLAISQLVSKN